MLLHSGYLCQLWELETNKYTTEMREESFSFQKLHFLQHDSDFDFTDPPKLSSVAKKSGPDLCVGQILTFTISCCKHDIGIFLRPLVIHSNRICVASF